MVSRQDIVNAREAIRDAVVLTPVVHSRTLSNLCGCRALLKLENFQMTGAFKERGALNRLLSLSDDQRASGVITASAGNHAQGVAYNCQRLGIDAKIVMPVGTPLIKVVSTQNYGAHVVLHGESYDEACERAMAICEQEGRQFIHPFDDPDVIAGQGTIAIELLEHELCKDLDAVLCPIGGGGLISGIATYIKETKPSIRVIGVETAVCPSMKRAIEAGGPVEMPASSSLADGIAVKTAGKLTSEIVKRYVDDIVTVEEDEIANAVLLLLEIEKIMVEGSGAVPLAALIKNKAHLKSKNVVSIISGGNIDVNVLARIITRGLAVDGRIVQLKVRLRDVPGTLNAALQVLKNLHSNVLEVSHHRYDSLAPFGFVDVSMTLETKGHRHIQEIEHTLRQEGLLLQSD